MGHHIETDNKDANRELFLEKVRYRKAEDILYQEHQKRNLAIMDKYRAYPQKYDQADDQQGILKGLEDDDGRD